jgi:hypothetical protein
MSRNWNFANGTCLWNPEKTGLKTVKNPKNIAVGKGVKQVCQATNAEEGSLITTHCFTSTADNIIPTVIVFLHVHFTQFMNKNAPPGTLRAATCTGWITSASFVDVTKHFI